MMTNNISLYFHIPFCVKKCDYCAFYSLPNQKDDIKQKYFEALSRQIDLFETEKSVSTVYFGGGTPPLLGIDRICKLIKKIKSKFTLIKDYELTVEINPGTVDKQDLEKLFNNGVNRLSIGIQSADDDVLKSIGRIHTFEQAKECIENARLVGFENISADVIFALPDQSLEQFTSGLNAIINTGVEHISAYSLQLEEGTPLFLRADKLIFPNEEQEEKQYDALCNILSRNDFEHYEISSFCKKGFESKHNTNYWLRGEYFGFGAGAHSFYEGKRFATKPDVMYYIQNTYGSVFAPTNFNESDFITPEEAIEEEIMLGLRTNKGAIIPQNAHKTAERIANLGYGSFKNGVLTLNSKGFRVSNEIISEILV